jgi:hypothetical protein
MLLLSSLMLAGTLGILVAYEGNLNSAKEGGNVLTFKVNMLQ